MPTRKTAKPRLSKRQAEQLGNGIFSSLLKTIAPVVTAAVIPELQKGASRLISKQIRKRTGRGLRLAGQRGRGRGRSKVKRKVLF